MRGQAGRTAAAEGSVRRIDGRGETREEGMTTADDKPAFPCDVAGCGYDATQKSSLRS